MKIGLNGTCFNQRPSGAKQRFVGIYSKLFELMPNDEFVIYEPSDCKIGDWFNSENVRSVKTPIPSEGRLKKYFLGINFWKSSLLNENFDIFESFNQPIIKPPNGITIQTIHDIRSISVSHSKWLNLISKYTHYRSIKKADHVLTVSSAMKKEILSFFPFAKVTYIFNGIDGDSYKNFSLEQINKVRDTLDLPPQFILSVGHFEDRKNYLNLIEAIRILKDKGKNFNVVIIGNDNGAKKHLEKIIQKYNLSDNVNLFSGLSDIEVACIYSQCNLFAFPSNYEGFGIPILEAMAANKPMILSDLPVFREITQDNALFFKGNDIDSICSAICKAMSDDKIFENFISNYSKRIHDFDFNNLALQLKSLYRSLHS